MPTSKKISKTKDIGLDQTQSTSVNVQPSIFIKYIFPLITLVFGTIISPIIINNCLNPKLKCEVYEVYDKIKLNKKYYFFDINVSSFLKLSNKPIEDIVYLLYFQNTKQVNNIDIKHHLIKCYYKNEQLKRTRVDIPYLPNNSKGDLFVFCKNNEFLDIKNKSSYSVRQPSDFQYIKLSKATLKKEKQIYDIIIKDDFINAENTEPNKKENYK